MEVFTMKAIKSGVTSQEEYNVGLKGFYVNYNLL